MSEAVEKARIAWQEAPMHVRMMAGQYVDPLIVALLEVSARVERAESAVKELSLRVAYAGGWNGQS